MLFADSTSAAPTTTPFIQIALVIFLAVFVGIALWVILARRGHFADSARIPLDEGVVTPRFPNSSERPEHAHDGEL